MTDEEILKSLQHELIKVVLLKNSKDEIKARIFFFDKEAEHILNQDGGPVTYGDIVMGARELSKTITGSQPVEKK